tara:strand:- start:116 stop:388 length:273 start_codon:yes stop_codon:yes gene_type:complete
MSKRDYKDSQTINEYRTLVAKPSKTPATITVATAEKRTRAELLDMVEELFEENKDWATAAKIPSGDINLENLRALLHILIKSVPNTLDRT